MSTIASRTQTTFCRGIGAMLALASVTGCAARGHEPPEPRIGTTLISKVRQMLVKPRILTWGEQKLTARCMAAKDLRYEAGHLATNHPRPTLPSLGGFGTPLAVEEATDGYPYQPARSSSPPLRGPGRTRYERALDAEHSRQVQIGIPGIAVGASTGGCVAEARRQLYGSVRNYLMVEYAPQGIRQFGAGALDDARVRRAVAEYEACMHSAGYAAGNPGVARRLAARRFSRSGLEKASPAEVEMATADARCQARSEVYASLDDAVVEAASDWLRVTESDLEKTFEIRSRAMDRASELRQDSSRR